MSPKLVFKHFFKTAAFRTFICALISGYIRLVYWTSFTKLIIDEETKPYARGEKQAVFAFWHGRLLMIPPLCPKGRKMHVLISTHRDGELIARTMHHFGFGTVRGSTTRGGITAAMGAVKALQAGDNLSVTPDGPRGPAMQIQPGLLQMAVLAGVPVIPVCYSSNFHMRMKSWDRFMVPFPFGKIIYKVGAPVSGGSKEALEASMIKLTQEVDALV